MDFTTKQNNWYILGAGSMGRLWSASLSTAGVDYTLLLRDGSDKIHGQNHPKDPGDAKSKHHREQNYAFRDMIYQQGPQQEAALSRLSIKTCEVSQLEKQSVHCVVIATKSYDTERALQDIIPYLANPVVVVFLANGLGYQQRLIELLSRARLAFHAYWAISSDGAIPRLLQPAVDTAAELAVTRTGNGNTRIGLLSSDNHKTDAEVEAERTIAGLVNSLDRGGLNVSMVPSVAQALWAKFFINCAINALTVVYECRNGELLTVETHRQHFQRLCQELTPLYQSINFDQLEPARVESTPSRSIMEASTEVIRATSANRSSMLQDFQAGRKNELDYLNRYCITLLEKFEYSANENRKLVSALDSLYSSFTDSLTL